MSAPSAGNPHRAVPRYLLELHRRASNLPLDGEGIQAWMEWEWEATCWRVPVEISRAELEAIIERGMGQIERESHGTLSGAEWSPR